MKPENFIFVIKPEICSGNSFGQRLKKLSKKLNAS